MAFSEFLNSTVGIVTVQIIGFIAMSFGIYSFQLKRRSSIIIAQSVSSVIWTLQLSLLGAYTGAAQNAISVFRGILLANKDKRAWISSRITLFAIMIPYVICGVITFRIEGAWALAPTAASLIQSVALFSDNKTYLRAMSIAVSALWLSYNIRVASIAGIICETFVITSIIISLFRYRKKGEEKESKDTEVSEADI